MEYKTIPPFRKKVLIPLKNKFAVLKKKFEDPVYGFKFEKIIAAIKKIPPVKLVLIGVGVLLLTAVISIVAYGCSILSRIDFVSDKDMVTSSDISSIVLDADDIVSSADTISKEEMTAMDEHVSSSVVGEDGLMYQEGVTNILILGTDGRQASTTRARSDVIIIMSICEHSNRIVLNSIMRDTYVSIPGRGGNDKINAAHAYGGPALAMQTVEQAFGIKIDHFVSVNFYAFMDVVDALGGVDVEINSGEQKWLNRYVAQINRYMGLPEDSGLLHQTGDSVHLTGKQAMGYVRVRYVGNGDYERTERQREILEQIIKKARTADVATLLNVVEEVAGNMSTDYTPTEIMGLAMDASDYLGYEIVQQRLPVDDSYVGGIFGGIWILKIDFEANRQALYNSVFS